MERPVPNDVTTVYVFKDSTSLTHTENSYIFEYQAQTPAGSPVKIHAAEPAAFPPHRGYHAYCSATTWQPLIDNATGWETLMELLLDIEALTHPERPLYASRCRAISYHCPLPGIELLRPENYAELNAMHHRINEAVRDFLPDEIFDLARGHLTYHILEALQDLDETQYTNLRDVMLAALTDNPDIEEALSYIHPNNQDPEAENPLPRSWFDSMVSKVLDWKENNPEWDQVIPRPGI